MTRRRAIEMLGGGAGVALLLSCGAGSGDGTAASATRSGIATVADTSACTVTPEAEVGANFLDERIDAFNRSDIRSNLDGGNTQNGIALTLYLVIVDTQNHCTGVDGVHVDIWHCNAEGIYSGETIEGTRGETWLRGYQISDSAGQITFNTIVPGDYADRAAHIHLRLATPSHIDTTQLFFPTLMAQSVMAEAPYRRPGRTPVATENDPINIAQTAGGTLLNVSGSIHTGFIASLTLGLPITAI